MSELDFSEFEERWANRIAEYESDDIVSDIIRPMARELRRVDVAEVAALGVQLEPYINGIQATAVLRSLLAHFGIKVTDSKDAPVFRPDRQEST